ncbi:MAG: histone H1 [Actinobacteria bacterium]|nr:histone H1 [Actinomycetota bacterium]
MTKGLSRRPRDVNQLAASIVRDTTEDKPDEPSPETVEETERLRENGRRGGLKGGRARADKLSAEQRSEIARKAARARWASNERA